MCVFSLFLWLGGMRKTGAAVGFSMVGAKLPVNARQVMLTSLKISHDFQPKSLETCLSNEFFPVFASTASDAAALSVSIPECKVWFT